MFDDWIVVFSLGENIFVFFFVNLIYVCLLEEDKGDFRGIERGEIGNNISGIFYFL